MAETSILWTTGTSGDGTSPYTQTQTTDAFRDLFLSDNFATEGVLLGNGGELLVTGTATPVSVASGAAVVYGFFYRNTAAVTFAVATPVVGTTAHRIVLRADYSARTVRLAKLSATDGVNTPPAVTQIANTTWEISIATLSITTGGVITVTPDTNRFAHYPTAVATENIDASAVTTAKINDSAVTTAKIADANVTAAKLAAAVAGDGLAGGAGSALSVNVDASTIEINSDTLRVKDSGISTAKLANDSVDDTKAGDRVPQFYRRQGGDASDWRTVGTTTYTPTSVRQQAGANLITGGVSQSGTLAVTFPTAYSNPPIVMVTSGEEDINVAAETITSTGFTLSWKSVSATAGGTFAVYWFVVGPE